MTIYDTYYWTTILICIGVFQNSLGDLVIASKYPAITNFKIASQPFVSRYAKWSKFFYESPGVKWSKIIVILCAGLSVWLTLMTWDPAIPLAIILLLQTLSYPRWRFFISSDSPLLRAILFTLVLYYAFPQNTVVAEMGLFFMSAYLSLIYFFAGIQKLKSQAWRSGKAIIQFANKSEFWRRLGLTNGDNWFLKTTAWGIILFELFFFMGLFSPEVIIVFMALGFLFHGILSLSMGINHFFWTFISGYFAYLYTGAEIFNWLFGNHVG